jgi:AcrR family transcriptional regulator
MPSLELFTPTRTRLSTASVVNAAIELVDEQGRSALTLAAVAKRTGVATPSLYKHISSLKSLQQKVSARVTGELAQVLSSAVAGRSGQNALRCVAHAYRDYALTHPGWYSMTQSVPDIEDPEHVAAGQQAVNAMFAALLGYGLGGDDAVDATRLLRSALHGFVSLEVDDGFGLPQDVERSFDRLISALHVSLSNWGEVAE